MGDLDMSREKSFTLNDFVGQNQEAVLSAVPVSKNDEGHYVKAGDWKRITTLASLTGKFGKFLMNPLPEEERGSADTFFIGETNPEKKHLGDWINTVFDNSNVIILRSFISFV